MIFGSRTWLGPALKPIRGLYREILTVSLFTNLIALSVPLFVLQVYDKVVGHAGLTTLQALIIGMGVALGFDFVLRQARSRTLQRVGLRIDVQVGRALFSKFSALPLATLESRPTSFWQALFHDVEMVRNGLSGAAAAVIADLPFIVFYFGLIAVIAAPIAWVLLVMLGLLVLLAIASAVVVGRSSSREREQALARDGLLGEMIAGRTTVKALSLDKDMSAQWEARQADLIESALTRGRQADAFHNLGFTVNMTTTVLLTSFGALAVLEQSMTIGALVAANILGSRFIAPIVQLLNNWRTFAGLRQSAARLDEVFALAEDRTDATLELPRPMGRLATENVSFAYQEESAPVISQITMRLGPSGLHAIVGPNGSGKTTLLNLLQGLYAPSDGRVLLDEADVSQFSRKQLSERIGYVPQDCFLFAGTIHDNIAKGAEMANDEAVLKAAQLAGVHDFVIDLPDGYGTEIGEAGRRLSGGQRQRISIARALLRDPPILLLDEPTANLDQEATDELAGRLVELAKTRTIVVVTHSPAVLRLSDSIMVLQKGKIALAGRGAEILPRILNRNLRPAASE
ncbi:MAG: ATP-binding cassette domain-containing protein [Pseudomonadota bacterium]